MKKIIQKQEKDARFFSYQVKTCASNYKYFCNG